jgi:phosphotransferase system  glucose/maltose/N-acetylglucosamine-specific IIC component/phosphotransferase system IIB component
MTRLRLNIIDKSRVQIDEIKKINGVLGAVYSGDQLQIIIGQDVADVYEKFCVIGGFAKQKAVEENLDGAKTKFSIKSIFEAIAGCVTPVIPVLIGGGFIKIVVLLGNLIGLLPEESGTYIVLTFLGDAAFYFLPVFIGATAAKRFKANMGLGMLVGAMLIHPTFVNAVSEGTALTIFGIPIYSVSYSSTILPAILAVWVMSYVERFIAKKSPEAIRSMTEPLLTLLIMAPLTLCVLGPIGSFCGTYLSKIIIGIYDLTGFLGVGVLSAILPFLVMTGMHSSLMPYAFNAFATLGYEPIVITANIISNIDQGAASLAVAIKSKDKELKSTASSAATTAVVAGVSEPAMYGVNLKLRTPLYGSVIGSFVGGCVAGIGKTAAYSAPGGLGIFAFPIYITENVSNLLWWCAAVVAGFIATFIATMIIYKPEKTAE